ncbi:cytochrome b/b6 domain-containing protein [Ruegeria sp. ANG10]|uniref:cytochrome b n=1 Tax=Ruegeria sp. ANG10 TaxID=3042467 RepID=UPI003454C995
MRHKAPQTTPPSENISTVRDEPEAYTGVARWLHWIMAVFILTTMFIGFGLDEADPVEVAPTLSRHANFGVLTLSFAVLRLFWRLAFPPPRPHAASRLHRLVIEVVHLALYALMILVPVTGILAAIAHDLPTGLFWAIDLRETFSFLDRNGYETRAALHAFLVHMLQALLVLHITGALTHQYYLRDNIMRRMKV